jgi:glycosyltransferase involved in cell wall biosynthesis
MTTAATLVSVIMPACNASRFIERALNSVRNQTHTNIEILVIDDGSTDQTAAIVETLAHTDPRIRLFRTPRRGVSAARNFGIGQSVADLIATIDADDLWSPEKLQLQVAAMLEGAPRTGLVYCWSAAVDEDDRITILNWSCGDFVGNVRNEIVAGNFLGNGSTPLFRRAALEAVRGYDVELMSAEDWKLYMAMSDVCEFSVVRRHLVGYRLWDESASMNLALMETSTRKVGDWARIAWPDIPKTVWAVHESNVNGYFAFMAMRKGKIADAMRYRTRSCLARPGQFLRLPSLSFCGLLFLRALGRPRYYWYRTRKPFLPAPRASVGQ